MSLAQLFYRKETLREHLRRRRVQRLAARSACKFRLEPLEPRLLLSSDALAVPVFEEVEPAGALVYEASVSGSAEAVAEIDTLNLSLDAGQVLTAVFSPQDPAIQGRFEILGPNGTSLGAAQASGAGESFAIQGVAIAQNGTFSLDIHSLAGTGGYDLRLLLNSLVEPESFGGPAHDSVASAFSLEGSSVALQGSADRLAVIGTTDATSDFYSVELTAGEAVAAVLADLDSESTSATFSLDLLDPEGTLIALGQEDFENVHEAVHQFIAPTSGTYFLRVHGDGLHAGAVLGR